jgi:exosortase family protein XrtM
MSNCFDLRRRSPIGRHMPDSNRFPRLYRPRYRLLAFVALFAGMYAALSQAWGEGLSHWLIDWATVKPAAWIARQLSGHADILADGSHLRSMSISLNILYGCEGTDALMLLASALLVAPASFRDRLIGVAAGTGFVFAVNQVRVLVLFFSVQSHPAWFGPLHGLIAPLSVVVLVVVFFLCWLRWAARAAPDETVWT